MKSYNCFLAPKYKLFLRSLSPVAVLAALLAIQVLNPVPVHAEADSSESKTAPHISFVELQDLQSIYNSISGDPSCARSFCVSPDGKHCASFKFLGLNAVTAQIDGKPGPTFSSAASAQVFPSKTFDRIFYGALDANSHRVLVIQSADGKAGIYPASPGNQGEWLADAEQSCRYLRLVRTREHSSGPNTLVYSDVQIDDGPVLGPFLGSIGMLDANPSHYVFSCLIPTSEPTARLQTQEFGLFKDGVRVGRELLPKEPPAAIALRELQLQGPGGEFYARIDSGFKTTRLLDGKALPNFTNTSTLLISPDGKHYAYTQLSGQNTQVCLDGVVQNSIPAGAHLEKMLFTGDSAGIIYSVKQNQVFSIFANAAEVLPSVEGSPVELWAGPVKGTYACFVAKPSRSNELVVNGRHLDFSMEINGRPARLSVPGKLLFTRDGGHVFGYLQNSAGFLAFFDDAKTIVKPPEGTQFVMGHTELVIADEKHWSAVGESNPATAAKKGGCGFVQVEVEMPGK